MLGKSHPEEFGLGFEAWDLGWKFGYSPLQVGRMCLRGHNKIPLYPTFYLLKGDYMSFLFRVYGLRVEV